MALASIYVEQAETLGRPEYATRAVEEYKLALNADPDSSILNDGLADLYFRAGRFKDAESTARGLLKNSPNDLEAHKLLGKIYLRLLGEGQSSTSSPALAGSALELAIAEFETIVALQPKSVEDRMVLGQLYTVKHDAKKAEEEFKIAQTLEPDSEEAVLNLARLYAESGDVARAAKIVEAVPAADRSPKMELALGAAYDQLKQSKDAIAAYRRAADLDPGDAHALGALAQALLNDGQLDEALKQFQELAEADPEDSSAPIHIAEIQRRQGKYAEALTTIQKVSQKSPDSLEAGYNEGLLLDVLGRFDEAAQVYEKMVNLTSHANGAYTAEEKNDRGIFLERLGAVYQEQNKVDQAVAAFQKMIDMGGDTAVSGYRGQVGAYSDAKLFDKAVEVSRKAVEANPKDRELKLMLAGELADQGKTDEGLALANGLLDNSAEDRMVWLELGQIYIRARRWSDSENAFDKAEALTTKKEDRAYLLFLRGELAERQKHYRPAKKFFRKALELDPSSAMTLNYLGYMMADKGTRLREALKLIRKAVELEPMNGAFLDSLGWAYFKLGQYELAEENLRQAVERDQTDPTVHDHLGDLYEKTGRIRLAAQQWELSLAAFAKSAPSDVEPGEVAKVQRKLESARAKLAKQESATGAAKPE
jgi:tetratricopeptide (TPR) repeat protein